MLTHNGNWAQTNIIQSLEEYDSTLSPDLVLKKQTKMAINCNIKSQYSWGGKCIIPAL